MRSGIEREVKLDFAGPDAARAAVVRAGGVPLRARRLQDDWILDTSEGALRSRRCVLRVRYDGGSSTLTFKGPPHPGRTKAREELETEIGEPALVVRVFEELGYRPWFRYQKYREEFRLGDVVAAVDETPVGTFVELEGTEAAIEHAAAALGRSPADYLRDSYHALFLERRVACGLSGTDMVFEPGQDRS